MAPEAIAIEKIEGAVANDLIGDVRITHGDISGLGGLHDGDSLSHHLSRSLEVLPPGNALRAKSGADTRPGQGAGSLPGSRPPV
jgi:hypothetical protein